MKSFFLKPRGARAEVFECAMFALGGAAIVAATHPPNRIVSFFCFMGLEYMFMAAFRTAGYAWAKAKA